MNGTRSQTQGVSWQGKQSGHSMTRRAGLSDESPGAENVAGMEKEDDRDIGMPGPVTARLKLLEKKFSHVLEMQAKFNILDKWIQQQFGVALFPPSSVNTEKFEERNPEDVDNPFYAVYLVIQRMKQLEEKVKILESRPSDDIYEPKPTSNYSSTHAFRNFKASKGPSSGGVKRGYVSSAPPTPKKAKLMQRPAAPSANYPFKPSVKILPKDPSMPSPVKKEKEEDVTKEALLPKPLILDEETKSDGNKQDEKDQENEKSEETVTDESKVEETPDIKIEEEIESKMEIDEDIEEVAKENTDEIVEDDDKGNECPTLSQEANLSESVVSSQISEMKEEVDTIDESSQDQHIGDEAPILEDETTEVVEDDVGEESGQEDGDMDVEQKPVIDEDLGDVSGSEASVSSLASSSSKPRLSSRRRQVPNPASNAEKSTEEEKPVMYTARGRRHTVPRRYAEFTGHDNVVSILKSQQRAEKTAAAAGSSKGTRKQAPTPTKGPDVPPKIKKMVKATKSPSPKKPPNLTDSDGEGDASPTKKKTVSHAASSERPACVDALVERVLAREVDDDGMVVLSVSYPNIYVNQQQLVTVIVRSNGKSTRLTRKMTTLVFEDSVLASASPFGTKYYKDRLPPEPLEAMVDFIAESGFEPHYSKKKIYMIVGQVCNEARAGRVSRKFMHPLEATPGTSQQSAQDTTSSVPASPNPDAPTE